MLVSELFGFKAGEFERLSQAYTSSAQDLTEQADTIYGRDSEKLSSNWKDKYASKARDEMEREARSCEILAMKLRGAVSILDGFVAAMQTQRRELELAVIQAEAHSYYVNDDGQVRAHDPTKQSEADAYTPVIQGILSDASAIDSEATKLLGELEQHALDVDKDGDVDEDDVNTMRDEVLDGTAQATLDLMRQSMPTDASAEEQREWWEGLTDEQRQQFMLALPLEVYGMEGVPEEVKRELEGDDGYNRMTMLQFALDNANNRDMDIFDSNCAHFVSSALEAAGMKPKGWVTLQDDAWGHNEFSQWDTSWRDFGPSHTYSWVNAEANQNFFLNNGGERVDRSDVRPGDIIYWEQAGDHPTLAEGETSHAAIVTGVTPSGDILYTQHTDSRDNVSLNGRLPHTNVTKGDQNIVIVRPRETW
ncbi:amidase domain-containing protein [Tessaracoccus sp. OH4464_COT-324]|uniref:amidase domain-containing protein n=1 Tax=Tessaracoccus sp. OH4464_COT-324 TaxID=2491059 RepID=UPI000F62CCEA|nr:amidase domain-containing protein [Tessaracoccus sp. OH4464_COT-324]RRD46340.1 hypothetical protein EII42_07470 [Tessaracoccus sp. OH4464_COT-324]